MSNAIATTTTANSPPPPHRSLQTAQVPFPTPQVTFPTAQVPVPTTQEPLNLSPLFSRPSAQPPAAKDLTNLPRKNQGPT